MSLEEQISAAEKELAREKKKVSRAKTALNKAQKTGISQKILMANRGLQIAQQFCIEAEKNHKKLLLRKVDATEKRKKVLLERLLN